MDLRAPLPDAFDRLSILLLKLEHMEKSDPRRAGVQREHDFYQAVVESYRAGGLVVRDEWLQMMIDINRQCWDMEADIRDGRDGAMSLADVGERALRLRDLNKIRIERKNMIAKEVGNDFFETKIDHASE